MAKSVVSYPVSDGSLEVLTLSNSDALSAYVVGHDYRQPANVVLVGSGPQEAFDDFIRRSGLTASMYHFRARTPLTLYRIRR